MNGGFEEGFYILQQIDAAVAEVWLLLDLGRAAGHVELGELSGPLLVLHSLPPLAGKVVPQGLAHPCLTSA